MSRLQTVGSRPKCVAGVRSACVRVWSGVCSDTGCYLCLLILRRSVNVIQYRESKWTLSFRCHICDDYKTIYDVIFMCKNW